MLKEKECDYLFKFILIGTSGVGKTCLMVRFADEVYESTQASTIGVDFKIKTINLENATVKLQIWDTAGQERFRAIVSNYYRGAHGILVVFDMTSRESFTALNEWISEIRKNTKENVEILILGNKIDKSFEIVVTDTEINEFLQTNGINKECFLKTSAKDNIGVNESFESLAKRLINKYKSAGFESKNKDALSLQSGDREGKSCCM